jgi:hypothetical protein
VRLFPSQRKEKGKEKDREERGERERWQIGGGNAYFYLDREKRQLDYVGC